MEAFNDNEPLSLEGKDSQELRVTVDGGTSVMVFLFLVDDLGDMIVVLLIVVLFVVSFVCEQQL